jgi:hypothetical protein
LIQSYLSASVAPSTLEPAAAGQLRLPGESAVHRLTAPEAVEALGREKARFVEAVVDASACRPGTTMTFQYDPAHPEVDFSHTLTLPPSRSSGPTPTRVFEPVYGGFTGIQMSDPACLPRVGIVKGTDRFPLLLPVVVTPDWAEIPQYQRIAFSK